jgi:hypothetical protein
MSDMTCHEFQSYFENELRAGAGVGSIPAEVSEHAGQCPECNCAIEAQRELAADLQLLRDSAPAVSEGLDQAVAANYHRYASEHDSMVSRHNPARRTSPFAVLGWATAIAFAVAVAYVGLLVFFPREQRRAWMDQSNISQPAAMSKTQATQHESVTLPPRAKSKRSAPALPAFKHVAAVKRAVDTVATGGQQEPPATFRSLMYCDQLACGGALDVIRVQMPSSEFGLLAVPPSGSQVVSADVLVGPDGVARGIRLVQ